VPVTGPFQIRKDLVTGTALKKGVSTMQIKVRTTISQGKEQETYELTTFGRFQQKGQSFYLLYEEVMDVGKVKTTVKFSEEDAVILRSGAVNMRLAFKLNHVMRGHYESPYGTMETITDTKKIDHQQTNESSGKLDLLYGFTMQGDPAGTYHMEITYKEDAKGNEHS
jgi:uncharacterized beta-barrel protein YwiB (DUF1934 family)